jgi:type II restriction enzyme
MSEVNGTTASIERALRRRDRLVQFLAEHTGEFSAAGIEEYLERELENDGLDSLLDHLAICGIIPERLPHDSTEEKLYSKYTDAVIALTFRWLSFRSAVVEERADSADVDVHGSTYAFVADAKAFRLSRTAKNQKDFKVEAMDKWRREKHYAVLVAPIFQFPSRASQIYEQATRRGVCLLTYSHLRVLVRLFERGDPAAEAVIDGLLSAPRQMPATKAAKSYWGRLNEILMGASEAAQTLWEQEKARSAEILDAVKREEITHIERELSLIENLSREDAIRALIESRKLPQRLAVISAVSRNELYDY